jgi:imidazoleglycerol-phosphate dehydratase
VTQSRRAGTGAASSARLTVAGRGEANVATGIPALDHLLTTFARYGGFDLALDVAPGFGDAAVAAAGAVLGDALAGALRAAGARGYGAASVPAAEALAHVALDVSDEPRLVSNVDLSEARVGGAGRDVVASFLREVAERAGLTLHIRVIEGADAQHVLESMFKTLGVAVSRACRATEKEEA